MLFNKKKIRSFANIVLSALFALVLIVVIFRQPIFRHFFNSKIEAFNQNHSGTISIESVRLIGISGVEIKNIRLSPQNNAPLIIIDSLNANLKFWNLIFCDINFNTIYINDLSISIIATDSSNNFSFLLKNKSHLNAHLSDTLKINYYKLSNIILNALFAHIPDYISLKNLQIFYKHNKDSLYVNSSDLLYNKNVLKGIFNLNDGKYKSELHIAGKIFPDSKLAAFKVLQPGKLNKLLSGLMSNYNADVSFDTAFFSFVKSNKSGEYVKLIGKSYINHFKINQPAISKTDVKFDDLKFNFSIRIGENYFQLDSSSTVYVNKLTFNPFVKVKISPSKQITFKIHKKYFPSQELFESLSEGLFHTLYGIKTNGELAYNLDFFVDLSIPDSLKFSSELKRKNFSIQKFGNVNYSLIQNEFEHTAFENGEPVKTFLVGFSNPNFTPINKISPFLRNAILCTEDAAFFYHRGFIPESIQQSIAEDIKRKKFARGGSTISMQLVKNVFLNSNKTIARKLEEVLIVWLIENQGLCTKDRMFEVYLNIIEWGPKIYGITDASRFYFNKKPDDLSLSEAIYLASIIPKPKYFKYCFDANGELNTSGKDFITAISNKMLKKEMIDSIVLQNLNPNIVISGDAKSYIVPSDSMPTFETLEYN